MMEPGRASGWIDRLCEPRIAGALLFGSYAAVSVLYANRGLPLPDEGAVLTNAAKLLRGAVYYRDIDAFPFPLATWILAGAMGWFGEHLSVARGLAGIFSCLAALSLYATALCFVDRRRAACFAVLLVAAKPIFWPAATIYLYSEVAFAFGCASVAIFFRARGRSARLGLAGALAALALISKQNLGIYLIGASLLATLTPRLRQLPAAPFARLREVAAYGTGSVLVVFAFVAQLVSVGVAGDALESGLLRPFSDYLPTSGIAFLPPLEWWRFGELSGVGFEAAYIPAHPRLAVQSTWGDVRAVGFALEFAARFVYTSIPAVVLLGLVLVGRRREAQGERGVPALVFVAVAVAGSAWPRTDYFHIGSVFPLVALAWIAASAAMARRGRAPWLLALVVTATVLLAATTALWWVRETPVRVRMDRADLRVGYADTWIAALVAGIRGELAPDEPLFVYGQEAQLYFLSDRYFDWRFAQLYPGQTGSADGEEVVAALERAQPRLIVRGAPEIGVLPKIESYAAGIPAYLRRHYSGDRDFFIRHPPSAGASPPQRLAVLEARSPGAEPRTAQPDLVLVMVDNLRADHLGFAGYSRPTSPVIDQLAASGTFFARAMASSSWTRPSVASLFTSRLPSEHGAVAFDRPIDAEIPTLAEQLRDAGYLTVGVSGNFVHVNRGAGMHRGFEIWRQPSFEPDGEAFWGGRRAARGAEMTHLALSLVPEPSSRPIFLYVHYMDPHAPFAPRRRDRQLLLGSPEAGGDSVSSEYLTNLAAGRVSADAAERARIVSLYDAEIAGVDDAIGDLLSGLAERGYVDPVVALVSDHGEEFGEHERWFHALQLYAESVEVPIILSGGQVPRAVREEPVDLLDVPTTLLRLAGAAPAKGSHGRDLLSAAPLARDLVAELHPDPAVEKRLGLRKHRLAVARWPWKAIIDRDGSAALYDLSKDPTERHPIGRRGSGAHDALAAPGVPADLADLAERIRQLERDLVLRDDSGPEKSAISPTQAQELRALGYIE